MDDNSLTLNGLEDVNADSVTVDTLVANQAKANQLVVAGNASVVGDLRVTGAQVYTGSAIFENSTRFDGQVKIGDVSLNDWTRDVARQSLQAGSGISYDVSTGTISSYAGGSWALNAEGGLTNTIGAYVNASTYLRAPKITSPNGTLYLGNDPSADTVVCNAAVTQTNGFLHVGTRAGGASMVRMNVNSTGSSAGAGIYMRDDVNTLFELSKMLAVSADRLSYELQPPANNRATVRIRPKVVSGLSDETIDVILSTPYGSSQRIESAITASGTINSLTALHIGGNDYKSYFSADGGLLAYDGAGKYTLTQSAIRALLSAGGTLTYDPATGQFSLVSSAIRSLLSSGNSGLTYDPSSGQFKSSWDVVGTATYPRADLGVTQLCIGFTGSSDPFNGIHIKSATGLAGVLAESTSSTWDAKVTLRNSAHGKSAYITHDGAGDCLALSVNSGNPALKVTDGAITVNSVSNLPELNFQGTVPNPKGGTTPAVLGFLHHDGRHFTLENSVYGGMFFHANTQPVMSIFDSGVNVLSTNANANGTLNIHTDDGVGGTLCAVYGTPQFQIKSTIGSIDFYTKSVQRMRIASDGFVGIGNVTTPSSPLHVAWNGFTSGVQSVASVFAPNMQPSVSAGNRVRQWFGVNTNQDQAFAQDFLYLYPSGISGGYNYMGWAASFRNYALYMTAAGGVGIPNLGGNGNQLVATDNNGNLFKAGTVCDRRLKRDICGLDCPISKIEKLGFYKFKYTPPVVMHEVCDDGKHVVITDRPDAGGGEHLGVMAQELLENGMQDCVIEEESRLGEKYYALDDKRLQWYFNRSVASLIKWNRKQEKEIEQLQDANAAVLVQDEDMRTLKEDNKKLQDHVEALQQELREIKQVLRKKFIL